MHKDCYCCIEKEIHMCVYATIACMLWTFNQLKSINYHNFVGNADGWWWLLWCGCSLSMYLICILMNTFKLGAISINIMDDDEFAKVETFLFLLRIKSQKHL